MNRKQRRRAVGLSAQQGRHQPGLPVVAVHDVWNPTQAGTPHGDLGDDAAEEGEALGVIEPVAAVGVEVGIAFALKGGGVIDQPHKDVAAGQAAFENFYFIQ